MFKQGDVIKGQFWDETVKVDFCEDRGKHLRLVGATTLTGKHVDDLIEKEKLADIQIINQKIFSQPAWKSFLALETKRYRYASSFSPLLAVSVSRVDPLPHQIEAVYNYVLKLPRIRFLIADDPGAGKTIMAGLIIKELKLRHVVRRILIVCPGHLKDQWKRELREKFEENFELIDRNRVDAAYGENIWQRENQVITSMDFAKRDDILPSIAASNFDLIVVDEAHKMSAYRYGDKIEKSDRYKLGETLSRISAHLLFLTATPHRGDAENFRLFLDLLQPGFFANTQLIEESLKSKDNPLFLRRIKEDLHDFAGNPLFLPRYVNTVSFKLSQTEKNLYDCLSEYVVTQYNKAINRDKKRNVAFALVILQRRLASSTYALLKSLQRRKKKLEELLSNPQNNFKSKNGIFSLEEVEDWAEEERWQAEEKWETTPIAQDTKEIKDEIETLEKLIKLARIVVEKGGEIKLKKLKESLEQLRNKVAEEEDRKILIFTESRDTLEYLEKKIKDWGYKVNTIHGGMTLEERVKAETVFRNKTEVMIATEAAGEGINLQFCHMMINFDLPWNPNRLEQRMGRIHRYGQTKEVFVHNLVATDTREGMVMSRLLDKIEEIKKVLGSDKVFDVIGEIIDSKQFTQALLDAAVKARSIDEILKTIDIKVDKEYIEKVRENLGETLATRYIDYRQVEDIAQKAREYRLVPEYTQNYFLKAFEKAGGKIENISPVGIFRIKAIPHEIRDIAEEESFKKTYGTILREYPRVTFDKEISLRQANVEFISFGHPLFEAVMQWVEKFASEAISQGAIFYDPNRRIDGYILFYEGMVKDATGSIAGKQLFSLLWHNDTIKPVQPHILWDLVAEDQPENLPPEDINLYGIQRKADEEAIRILEEYRQELQKERQRQAEIKQKYGVKSLEYLICQLDSDLIELEGRREKGEDVELPIRNKMEQKRRYEMALATLKETIQREQCLYLSTPVFLGAIRVKPYPYTPFAVSDDMVSDEQIEAIGMQFVLEYERSQERKPEDVSKENLGYDIRSKDKSKDEKDRIRYIEVKTRAREGSIALTQNEWFKAQRFGDDYYLYVVFNAATKPELYIIQNPAKNLKPEQKIELVRFFVDKKQILDRGVNK